MSRIVLFKAAIAASAALLAGCTDEAGFGRLDPADPTVAGAPSLALSGVVAAGYAACSVEVLDANGAVVASGRSSALGRYAVAVQDAVPGAVGVVRATGCVYEDEATARTVRDAAMSAYFVFPMGDEKTVHVTPFTELVVRHANDAAAERAGGSGQMLTRLHPSDVFSAKDRLSSSLTGGMIDFMATEPVLAVDQRSATASEPSREYGLLLAALSGAGERDAVLLSFGPEEFDEDGLLKDESKDVLLTGAAAFELTARNLSGRPAPLAVAPAKSDGRRDGAAPVIGAVPVLEGVVGAAFEADLSAYVSDADGAPGGLELRVWALPEGLALVGTTISGTPTKAGTSQALLIALDGQGNGAVARAQFVVSPASEDDPAGDPVNAAPTAAATASVTAGRAPLEVSFDAAGSADPDGEIVA